MAQDNRGECSQGCSQRMHRPQQQIEVCDVSSLGEAEGRGWVSSCTRSLSCLHRLYIEQGLRKQRKLTRQQTQKKRLKRERGSQGSPGWLGAELRGEARPPKPPPGAFLSLYDVSSSSAILLFFSQKWLLFSQSPSHVRLFATPWTAAHRLPCPSPSPGICSNSCPLIR